MSIKIKICGLSTPQTMRAAIEAGADYVGLVLFPRSPRHLSMDQAVALADMARGRARSVVLLVDPDDALVDEVATRIAPDLIQLHGREDAARVRSIRRRSGREIIKAVSVATMAEVEAAMAYHAPGAVADLVLFDAKPPPDAALPGGNGLTFDWRILEPARGRIPFALAGGLTTANVADAIRLAAPLLVDVSSGVERAPGIKDPGLIHAFCAAARGD